MMLLVLEREGQSVTFNGKPYIVGGMVWDVSQHRNGKFCIVRKIRINGQGKLAALCEFEGAGTKELELAALEPVSQTMQKEAAQQYTLFYYYNGSGGTITKVLGISSDKGVLLRLMLEDLAETPDLPLTSSQVRIADGSFCFEFEDDDFSDPTYVEYTISPTSVYSAVKKGE